MPITATIIAAKNAEPSELAHRAVMVPYLGYEQMLGSSAYDREKMAAERAIRTVTDLNWTTLRLPKIFGTAGNIHPF